MAKVDIIMGVYNCEKHLTDSIESIMKQSFSDWCLIVCDDGSSDGTLQILEGYVGKNLGKIILLKNKHNMGLNYTLNKCLEHSNAEYIARMDGDDISKPDRLKKEINFLDHNKEYAFVSSAIEIFDERGVWGTMRYKEKPEKNDFLKISPFVHPAVMIRREAIENVGRYSVDDKLIRVEDYHLWFKLYASGYKGYNLQEVLYLYRDDKQSVIRRSWKNRINEFYVRRIGYKMLGLPWYKQWHSFRPIIIGLLPGSFYWRIRQLMIKRAKK